MVATARELARLEAAEFETLLRSAAPKSVFALWRGRLAHNLPEFCRYCWPERFGLPFNALHEALFADGDVPGWRERAENIRSAIAAPRGFGKSAIVTFAEIVHDIVYDREAYIVLMSAGARLSRSMSRDLRNAFQSKDSPLARLYGPFEVKGGVDEWEVSVRGRPSVGILAASFGTEVRGSKHPERGIRPTKVVIDDGEKKDRVRNPDQRHIWWQTLTKDVLKLGPRQGGTIYRIVGTVLHPDSMLARLLADPGWKTQKWKALISWPERGDLWERCRRIWADLTLGKHRLAAARAFFEANREEMERGASLLDPASRDLFELYEIIWSEGLSSFLQELQNDPVDPSAQIFFSERFARFRVVDGGRRDGLVLEVAGDKPRRVRVKDLRLSLRWDPSTGSAHGDYAAIAVVGRDHLGFAYVLDVWMRRAKPSEQLAAAWTLAERWGVTRGVVESNGFQDLVAKPYRRERRARREARKYWRLQLEPEPESGNKELRIATLEPDVSNGWLAFNDSIPQLVLEQFDQFPTADHDDGPDAVHGAWADLGGSAVEMERKAA